MNSMKWTTMLIGLGMATHAYGSEGVFLVAGEPDNVLNKVKYKTEIDFHVNKNGYVVDQDDNFLLGWNNQQGKDFLPYDWNMSKQNLGLVKLSCPAAAFQATTHINERVVLPSTAVDGEIHTTNWNIVDFTGKEQSILATWIKRPGLNQWGLHFSNAEVESFRRNFPGGPQVLPTDPYRLNFDPSGLLMQVDEMPNSVLQLLIRWKQDPATLPVPVPPPAPAPAPMVGPEVLVSVDLGPVSGPSTTRVSGTEFVEEMFNRDGFPRATSGNISVSNFGRLGYHVNNGMPDVLAYQLAHVKLSMGPAYVGPNSVELAHLSSDEVADLSAQLNSFHVGPEAE